MGASSSLQGTLGEATFGEDGATMLSPSSFETFTSSVLAPEKNQRIKTVVKLKGTRDKLLSGLSRERMNVYHLTPFPLC